MSGAHAIRLADPVGAPASRVRRLDPRAKLLGLTAVTFVAVLTPLAAWPVYVGCAAVLAAVALEARVPAADVWRRARVVVPPVVLAAAALPFVRPGGATLQAGPLTVHEQGLEVLVTVTAKAAIGTTAAVLLAATTTFPAVLGALERLRAPRLLVLIATVMYRYLFVVGDEARRMRAAMAARGHRPRHALRAAAIGRVAGALFLRAHARGERVHLAMLARGFAGTMPRAEPWRLHLADGAFVAGILLVLVPLRVLA